jgi:hypothetical protein
MLDTLQRQLNKALFTQDERRAWLLIDAMHRDVRDSLCGAKIPDDDIHLVALDRDDIPEERCPHLIAIDAHAVERLHASVAAALDEQGDSDAEQAYGFAVGGWLASDAPAHVLARHLSLCMKPRLSGVGRKYFRWGDRRVLEWMWPALEEKEQSVLLGPIRQWWTLDRCGKLVDHEAATACADEMPWQLTHDTWRHAQDCEPVQMLLRGWQRFQPQLPADYLERARQAVRAVRTLGLVEPAEIVLVATYVLQVHPRLCEHPLLRQAVHAAETQSRPLIEVLADIPDPDGWNRMRDELNQAVVATA